MRLGVVTSIPWLPGKSQEQCFLDALSEVEAAEALGFDVVWFTEHHFALHGLNSGLTAWLGEGLGPDHHQSTRRRSSSPVRLGRRRGGGG